jgi:hypothetical protein
MQRLPKSIRQRDRRKAQKGTRLVPMLITSAQGGKAFGRNPHCNCVQQKERQKPLFLLKPLASVASRYLPFGTSLANPDRLLNVRVTVPYRLGLIARGVSSSRPERRTRCHAGSCRTPTSVVASTIVPATSPSRATAMPASSAATPPRRSYSVVGTCVKSAGVKSTRPATRARIRFNWQQR